MNVQVQLRQLNFAHVTTNATIGRISGNRARLLCGLLQPRQHYFPSLVISKPFYATVGKLVGPHSESLGKDLSHQSSQEPQGDAVTASKQV
jgi:hypothetical protein